MNGSGHQSVQNVIAVIPARGNSKRIPSKNKRLFFGHPLIAYSIMAAKNAGIFNDIIVSTEDEELGEIASKYGARWARRPMYLTKDDILSPDVVSYVIEKQLELSGGSALHDTIVCLLHPSNPLRRAADICEHGEVFMRENRQLQVAVVPYCGISPHWALHIDEAGCGHMIHPKNFMMQSQHLATLYCPSGAMYWARALALLEHGTFYGPGFHAQPMNVHRGIDIDTPEDWSFAELIVHGLQARDGVVPLEQLDHHVGTCVHTQVADIFTSTS